MVINRASEFEIPIFDDGWWDSVLAEDEGSIVQSSKFGLREEIQKGTSQTDWNRAMQVYREDGIITLTVIGYNRGGLLVESDNLAGFVPSSHMVNLPPHIDENYREECFAGYIGRTIKVKIIECVPDEDRIVLSERAACSVAGKRTEIFSYLRAGQIVSGEVTNLTDFGAFIDLGGVEGLIHISELSWGRVVHPNQILQLGEKVEVLVLEVVPERCRIALSLKRLIINPWESAELRYPMNTIVPAIITALVPFGAFAKLEDGLEGLIHTSEIQIPSHVPMQSFLSPGQTVKVRVLQVDSSRQRLGLSMKLV